MKGAARALAAATLVVAAGAACGRLPRIIVLTDPLTPAEHVDLGLAYERQGELDLAAREYEQALRRDARFFRARVNLGNVRAAQGRFGEARQEYLEALEIRPGDPDATNNLAWAAALSGEGMEEALARLTEVVASPAARSPEILDTLAVLRMRTGRAAEAGEALDEAERLCRERGSGEGAARIGGPAAESETAAGCPEATLREIRMHRQELLERFPPAAPAPPVR